MNSKIGLTAIISVACRVSNHQTIASIRLVLENLRAAQLSGSALARATPRLACFERLRGCLGVARRRNQAVRKMLFFSNHPPVPANLGTRPVCLLMIE